MKYRGNQKDIANKVEDSLAYLWLPAALSLLTLVLLWSKFTQKEVLIIDQTVERNGQLQVFFDTGKGYSQEQSKSFVFNDETGRRQLIEIDLTNFEDLGSIRIDPIDNDGSVLLQSFRLKQKGFWRTRDLLKPEYGNPNDLRFQWNAKKAELNLYPDAGSNDPFFIVPYEFESLSFFDVATKLIVLSLVVLLVVIGLSWLSSSFGIWSISLFLYWISLFVILVRIMAEKYTIGVNRLSQKWGLVNPTSCVCAGILLSFLITKVAFDGLFWQAVERSRNDLYFEFEVIEGESENVRLFFSKDKGFRYSDSVAGRMMSKERPQRVRVKFNTEKEHVARIRLDPINGKGEVTLKNLRLRSGSRVLETLDMRYWEPNRELEILEESDTTWRVRSIGEDPFAVSPEFDISLKPGIALPVRFGFFLVVMFFISTGLLIYNRLITEGMSHQDILNLQRG